MAWRQIRSTLLPGRLSARLTLLVSFTAGFSVLIAVSSVLLLGWRSAESRALADARKDANSIAFSLAAPLAFADDAGAREALDLLKHRTDVLSVWVRGPDGILLHSRGDAHDPAPVRDGGGLRRGELIVTAPVRAGRAADLIGTVTLRIDMGGARAELRTQVMAASIATLLVLVLTVLLARQMARRMSVPVVRLAEAAAALTRDGSNPQRLQVSGPGEIGIALDAFNHMVDELAARDAAVRELTKELREAATAAESARQQAESASVAKTRFLANMSHELRSPLNGVIGAAQLLQKSDRDPAFRAELIRIIQASGTNLLDLIEGVLDVSRIESGSVRTEHLPFDLMTCLEAALAPAAANAAVKGLAVEFHIDADVPAWVVGDEARVRQLVQNLLGNAVKFSDAGMVNLSVCRGQQEGFLHFLVSDTGVGIPAHLLETIFQPFQQGDPSTTRRFGGSGLGLTICREVARLMQGDVYVESEPGAGSRFTLVLPLCAAAHQPATSTTPQLAVHCLEPDPARRGSLGALLARLRCHCTFHADHEALRAAAARVKPSAAAGIAWIIAADCPEGEAAIRAIQAAGHRRIGAIAGSAVDLTAAQMLSRPVTLSALQSLLASDAAGAPGGTVGGAYRQHSLRARVLVVEDDPVNRLVVRSMIEGHEFHCTVANDGASALQALSSEQFDAVLMDWQMPDMDGLEVTRHLRGGNCGNLNRVVPVIALTANAFAEDRTACLAAGMNDFLTKPVQAQLLVQTVQRWCGVVAPPEGGVPGGEELRVAAAVAASPAAGDTSSVYDHTVLAGFGGADDPSALSELLGLFRDNSGATLAAMESAAAGADWATLQRLAHTLKGSAGQVGAVELSRVAGSLERVLRGGGAGSASDVAALRGALDRFAVAVAHPRITA